MSMSRPALLALAAALLLVACVESATVSASATKSPTRTPTSTKKAKGTIVSFSSSPSRCLSSTRTRTPPTHSVTPSKASLSATHTKPPTATHSATRSPTSSPTTSRSPLASPTTSSTGSFSTSSSLSFSPTGSASSSATTTTSPTATGSVMPSASAAPAQTESGTGSSSSAPTASSSPSGSTTSSPSVTASSSSSASSTASSSLTPSRSRSWSNSSTRSPTRSSTTSTTNTGTASHTRSRTLSSAETGTNTPTTSATPTLTSTSSSSASVSSSPSGSSTVSVTRTPTLTSTRTNTRSQRSTASLTSSSSITRSVLPTVSSSRTSSRSATASASSTATPTSSVSASSSGTSSISASGSLTSTPTESDTSAPTRTASTSCSGTATLSLDATPSRTQSSAPSVTSSCTATVSVSSTQSRSADAAPSISSSVSTTATLSASPSTTPSNAAPTPGGWLNYGFDPAHNGINTHESVLTPATVPSLLSNWTTPIDGASITQPLYVPGVLINGVSTSIIVVGTEGNGTVWALNASSGAVVWKAYLGFVLVSACQNTPGGKWGIGGTPVVDLVAGVLYVVSTGIMHALSITTGVEMPGWPSAKLFNASLLHNWGALTLHDGLVYFALAGMCDHPTYYGQVLAINTSTAAVAAQWLVIQPSTGGSAGGIWGYGGVPLSPAVKGGPPQLWTSTGNVETLAEFTLYGEAVVRLTPDTLNVTAHWSPNALVDALVDGDLGGTPNVFSPAASSGCSADYLVTAQHKSGVLFLLNASNLTEIGMYQIAAATGDLINEATYDPVTNLLFVTVPNKVSSSGSYPGIAGVSNGLLAMRVMPNCTLAVAYSVSLGITSTSGSYSSAVMANGVVYFSDGAGRKLHAVNASNGASLWNSGTTLLATVYVAPTVANGHIFAVDYAFSGSSHVYAFGL